MSAAPPPPRSSADPRVARADELLRKARGIAAATTTSRVSVKHRAASQAFELAADEYRSAGEWLRAGDAYASAAEFEGRLDNSVAAASLHAEAGYAAARADTGAAVLYFGRAIGVLATLGHFAPAAALQVVIAELHEADSALEEAAGAYTLASECYAQTGDLPTVCRLLAKAGELLALETDLPRCHTSFERAARFARDHNLLKFRAPGLVFDACLPIIAAGDLVTAVDFVERACADDANFAVGRERRFLLDVVAACRAYDGDAFIDYVWNFDYARLLAPFELA